MRLTFASAVLGIATVSTPFLNVAFAGVEIEPGQGLQPLGSAEAPLAQDLAFFFRLAHQLLFAADGQSSLGDADVDIRLVHAWQLGDDLDLSRMSICGVAIAEPPVQASSIVETAPEVLEGAVDIRLKREHRVSGLAAHQQLTFVLAPRSQILDVHHTFLLKPTAPQSSSRATGQPLAS